MIAKDEEAVIERILKKAKLFADEIIVVDTGSKDRTVEIAKNYTNKIFYYKWNDDFSCARNFAIEKATQSYVMWLDADDDIDQGEVEKILKLKNNLTKDLYMFKYAVDFSGERTNMFFYRERLFKRSLNLRFQGFVHEAIQPQGEREFCDVTILHKKVKSSGDRNLLIYNKWDKKGYEFSPRDIYYYGRELYYNNQLANAVIKFNDFLERNGYLPDVAEAYVLLTDCYLKLQLKNLAKKTIDQALSLFIPYPEMLCKAGEVYLNLQNFDRAIFYYKCATVVDWPKDGFIRQDYSHIIPFIMLSVIYYQQKNYEQAKFYHNKAKQIDSKNPTVLYNDKFF